MATNFLEWATEPANAREKVNKAEAVGVCFGTPWDGNFLQPFEFQVADMCHSIVGGASYGSVSDAQLSFWVVEP